MEEPKGQPETVLVLRWVLCALYIRTGAQSVLYQRTGATRTSEKHERSVVG